MFYSATCSEHPSTVAAEYRSEPKWLHLNSVRHIWFRLWLWTRPRLRHRCKFNFLFQQHFLLADRDTLYFNSLADMQIILERDSGVLMKKAFYEIINICFSVLYIKLWMQMKRDIIGHINSSITFSVMFLIIFWTILNVNFTIVMKWYH